MFTQLAYHNYCLNDMGDSVIAGLARPSECLSRFRKIIGYHGSHSMSYFRHLISDSRIEVARVKRTMRVVNHLNLGMSG